jgi:hypothetical protein
MNTEVCNTTALPPLWKERTVVMLLTAYRTRGEIARALSCSVYTVDSILNILRQDGISVIEQTHPRTAAVEEYTTYRIPTVFTNQYYRKESYAT